MERILRQIEQELATVPFDTYPNIIYQVVHSDLGEKAELKGMLAQGDPEKPHTVVEVDFVRKATKLSRRQRAGLKTQKSPQDGGGHTEHESTPPPSGAADGPKITIHNSPIFVYGRYIKYSRNMTQSPLVINGELKTARSVSDFASEFQRFFSSGPVKFMACGREDIDVRCIGGRPFILEISSPRRNLHETGMSICLDKDVDIVSTSIVSKRCKAMINSDESSKFYDVVLFSPTKIRLQDVYELEQKTPLRVLHRRANMVRHKTVSVLRVSERMKEDGFYYALHIKASSGTYIKEWVNGDFGRTLPNLNADLLALDVASVEKSLDQSLVVSEFRLSKRFVAHDDKE